MLDGEWASKWEKMEGQEFPVLILRWKKKKKPNIVQICF